MLYAMVHTCKLSLVGLKQVSHKFQVSVVKIMTPCLQEENVDLHIRKMVTHSHEKEKKIYVGELERWLNG